jgi:flavin reductase (DIM6/NTAB) family NADH-FMN oxidoreductase RutF
MTQAMASAEGSETPATRHAIDARDLRNALGCFSTGVTVITALAPDGRNVGLTANSFSSVSLNPPLVLWSLVKRSTSLTAFQDATHFAVNVLGRDQEHIASHFARTSADKFAGIDWIAGLGGAPLLHGVLAQFQCRNAFRHDGGDHMIFIGAVEAYCHGPGEPLLYSRGQYGSFLPGA